LSYGAIPKAFWEGKDRIKPDFRQNSIGIKAWDKLVSACFTLIEYLSENPRQ